MSKISGINLGNPNEPFQVYGTQLGGRDAAINIQRPSANISRNKVAELAKHINANIKTINSLIERLSVMQEMMVIDEDTDSVYLDKNFVDEYGENVEALRDAFESVLKAVNQ
jgi:uncharacterized protein YjgD (DUF1641 family)